MSLVNQRHSISILSCFCGLCFQYHAFLSDFVKEQGSKWLWVKLYFSALLIFLFWVWGRESKTASNNKCLMKSESCSTSISFMMVCVSVCVLWQQVSLPVSLLRPLDYFSQLKSSSPKSEFTRLQFVPNPFTFYVEHKLSETHFSKVIRLVLHIWSLLKPYCVRSQCALKISEKQCEVIQAWNDSRVGK